MSQPSELAALMDVTAQTARRYLRESVTLPDGRQIIGWPPGTAGGQLLEHRLRDKLAAQIGGITEAVLPYGRADVLTAQSVFEVEPAQHWRNGVRQALAYSAQVALPPSVALFGKMSLDGMLAVYEKLSGGQFARRSATPVALWWWDGSRWQHVTGRGKCRDAARRLAGSQR